jgi:hypothetical protein
MAKRFHGAYEGKSGRDAQESSDGGMIPSGAGSHANMPQAVVMREYPKVGGFLPEGLDDSIKGIDSQVGADNSKKNSKLAPKKV